MTPDEARAWFTDQRSTVNYTDGTSISDAQERAMRQDAAMKEQAYWTLRAEREGLLDALREDTECEHTKGTWTLQHEYTPDWGYVCDACDKTLTITDVDMGVALREDTE